MQRDLFDSTSAARATGTDPQNNREGISVRSQKPQKLLEML